MTTTEAPGVIRSSALGRDVLHRALTSPITNRMVATVVGYGPSHHYGPATAAHAMVVVCVSGSGWGRMAGRTYRISPGTAFVIPPSVRHNFGPDPDSWMIWWCAVQGTEVAELIRSMGVTPQKPVIPVRSPDRVVALIDDMLTSMSRDHSPARVLESAGTAWKLLTRLSADLILPVRGDPLDRAMDHLGERLPADVRVGDLARLVGVSPSHLTALFHAATGGGVHAYHVGLRMAEARHLLDTTAATVQEVALRVGYRDPDYFSRHFSRQHGLSPSAYRRRER